MTFIKEMYICVLFAGILFIIAGISIFEISIFNILSTLVISLSSTIEIILFIRNKKYIIYWIWYIFLHIIIISLTILIYLIGASIEIVLLFYSFITIGIITDLKKTGSIFKIRIFILIYILGILFCLISLTKAMESNNSVKFSSFIFMIFGIGKILLSREIHKIKLSRKKIKNI